MDEDRARRVTDALRDRGIAAHLRKSGIDAYSVQVPAGQGREAVWGAEGTTGLEAEVLLDGDLVGFVPQIPGSENFDEAQIVDAIARADYDQPEGHERPEAPPPAPPLAHEGGVFRRFVDGFRYDSEALSLCTSEGSRYSRTRCGCGPLPAPAVRAGPASTGGRPPWHPPQEGLRSLTGFE
jgi:hypothetical protein